MADDPHALRPGASIAGYNIIRVLGAGGFGITYEADSPFTGKRVAIKEFFPRGIASREGSTRIVFSARDAEVVDWALKRFESSTLDQCKLKHPNIVDVIHYVKDNDTGYMIMEYVEGETLEHWLREREFLPTAEELQPLLSPVIEALEYLHARKMIHRDIAPDNIMIRADGTSMIIDFGAIKLIGQETQLRSDARSFAVMKQFYSPPEQIEDGGELDHRADIYSIGAVFYRALSGRPPASAEERMQKRAFNKPDPYVPLAGHAPHVSPDVAEAVDCALSFSPDQRYGQVRDFRGALGWDGVNNSAQTIVVPNREQSSSATAKSSLLWILPLLGIAAVVGYFSYSVGIFSFPVKQEAVAPLPPPLPKMEQTEVPQNKIFTPKDGEPDQPQQDKPAPEQREANLNYAKWYTGEVQFYRAAPIDNTEPLTTCVPGRRIAVIALVEENKIRISQGGDTVFIDIGTDGVFRFESGLSLSGKASYAGKITSETIEGEFVSTVARGACFGKLTAKATLRQQ
jgi:serine/threonine protein kinase